MTTTPTTIELVGGPHCGLVFDFMGRTPPPRFRVCNLRGGTTLYWGPEDMSAPLFDVTEYERWRYRGDVILYRETETCAA